MSEGRRLMFFSTLLSQREICKRGEKNNKSRGAWSKNREFPKSYVPEDRDGFIVILALSC